MMLQSGEGLSGPILQVSIVTALRIALKQRHRVLVGVLLHRIEIRAEVLAGLALELVEFCSDENYPAPSAVRP